MAKRTAGIVTIDDSGWQELLRRLGPNSRETQLFIKGALKSAANKVKPILSRNAIAAGFPANPGFRRTQGASPRSQVYEVFGRVPRAVRLGKYVARRKDGGDSSQRVIIGSKLRGTTVGAPHNVIVRYSKNQERFTKKGYSRGKFVAKPFVDITVQSTQGIVLSAIRKEYAKYVKLVDRGK